MGSQHSGVGERLSTSTCALTVEMGSCSTWKADGRKILEEEAGPGVSTRLHRTPRHVKAIQENDVCSTLFEVHWQRSRSTVEGRAASTRGGVPPYDWSGKFLAGRREALPNRLCQHHQRALRWHTYTHLLHAEGVAATMCISRIAPKPQRYAGLRERMPPRQGQTLKRSLQKLSQYLGLRRIPLVVPTLKLSNVAEEALDSLSAVCQPRRPRAKCSTQVSNDER
ncbi:unnamed protein product [Cercospora beticola]|nr:unnamed protein product [Cercospora beticola]